MTTLDTTEGYGAGRECFEQFGLSWSRVQARN